MKWAPPTEDRVMHIAAHLRKRDAMEVFCSHGMQPAEAVITSWKNSPCCRCIEGDIGEPVGLCGVLSDGLIWMLATDGLLATPSHRRQFARGAKQWVDGLVADGVGPLHNWALASNRTALRWLESLGFEIGTAAPMGPCGQLFCYFERTV
jgi:hypothetical protein